MVRVAQHLFEKEPCLLDIAGTGKTLDVPESAHVERALASSQSIDSSVVGIAVDQAIIEEPITDCLESQRGSVGLTKRTSGINRQEASSAGLPLLWTKAP